MTNKLIEILEDQVSVGFTGRVNILDNKTKQLYGYCILADGRLIHATYDGVEGIKAFFNIAISEHDGKGFSYVVEPEIVENTKVTVHYPYNQLKKKLSVIIENYLHSNSQRPPDGLKLIINPEFISSAESISGEEYDLLCTISDCSKVEDIYKNCSLLDYEITNTLVALRKKKALKVIKA